MNIKVPLHAVAHGRAGDKGNHSNISVIPYLPITYKYLLSQLTEEYLLDLFRYKGATRVKRYELPNFPALNFVLENVLGGGVNGSLNVDTHGKTLSFFLLGKVVLMVPKQCIPEGSPYLKSISAFD